MKTLILNVLMLSVKWMVAFLFMFLFALVKEIAGLPVTYIKILDAILFIGLLYITYDVIKKLF